MERCASNSKLIKPRKTSPFITEALFPPAATPFPKARYGSFLAVSPLLPETAKVETTYTKNSSPKQKTFAKAIPEVDSGGKGYYDNLLLKPGFKFYQCLCRLNQPIQKYGLRIPQTFYAEEQKLLAFDSSKDYLIRVDQVNVPQFKSMIEAEIKERIEKADCVEEEFEKPAYLVRKRTSTYDDRATSEVMTWKRLSERIRGMSMIELYVQKYIVPNKENRLLYRLTYYCNPEKSRKANCVEILAPKEQEEGKFWAYGDSEYVVMYRSYNGIKELERTAKKLTHLANREYGYRMNMMQLDFIKERQAEPMFWLVGLHSYRLDEESLKRISHYPKISTEEQTTPIKCTLCGLKYKRGEVEKCLPMKMLIELKTHMAKRRLCLFPSSQIVAEESLMHTCRVCTLCYQLIVQENKLISVEQEMARAQSIPVPILGTMNAYNELSKGGSCKEPARDIFSDTLIQWRIMIYSVRVSKFSVSSVSPVGEYSLDFSVFPNASTSFPIDFSKIQSETGFVPINKLRVHYFFSSSGVVEDLYKNSEVQFALLDPNGKLIAEGRSYLFKHFCLHTGMNDMKAEKLFKRVVLHTSKLDTFTIDFILGVCVDGEMDVKGIKLSRHPSAKVYFPEDEYYSSFPLPMEWVEAFDNSQGKRLNMVSAEGDTQYTYDASLDIEKIVQNSTLSKSREFRHSRAESASFLPQTTSATKRFTSTNPRTSLFTHNNGLVTPGDTSRNNKSHNLLHKYLKDTIPEKTVGRTIIRKRARSHAGLVPVIKMHMCTSERHVKRLKKREEYKKLPTNWFYMQSPYGNPLKMGVQLITAKHKRSKSEPRGGRKVGKGEEI